jgi:hypothetical protein
MKLTPALLRKAAHRLDPFEFSGLCNAVQFAAYGAYDCQDTALWGHTRRVLFGPDWATTYLPVSTKWSVGQAERFMYAHFMALWMEDGNK